ncbi:MAG: hypothetical protein JRN15_20000, partial [Nitrososphaerota archaeon]|nr:hypothetical protein [Nitrososphaerota archaeon]
AVDGSSETTQLLTSFKFCTAVENTGSSREELNISKVIPSCDLSNRTSDILDSLIRVMSTVHSELP